MQLLKKCNCFSATTVSCDLYFRNSEHVLPCPSIYLIQRRGWFTFVVAVIRRAPIPRNKRRSASSFKHLSCSYLMEVILRSRSPSILVLGGLNGPSKPLLTYKGLFWYCTILPLSNRTEVFPARSRIVSSYPRHSETTSRVTNMERIALIMEIVLEIACFDNSDVATKLNQSWLVLCVRLSSGEAMTEIISRCRSLNSRFGDSQIRA